MKNICLAALSPIIFAQPVFACWRDIPLQKLVYSEPVIVTGKLGKIIPAKNSPGQRPMSTGNIRITSILKNSLPGLRLRKGDALPLIMPSLTGGPRISTDIIYKEKQDGIWLLEPLKNGYYAATYPKDYQPSENLKKIKSLLLKADKDICLDVSCHIAEPSSDLQQGELRATLSECDPFLADAPAKKVDAGKYPFQLKSGHTRSLNFSLTAPSTERMHCYLTVFVHPDAQSEKRIYFADGFNKVYEKGNYEKLGLRLKATRR